MLSTDALLCNATFEANPDVAGLGVRDSFGAPQKLFNLVQVLIAFKTTAWITILIALFAGAISLQASIRSLSNRLQLSAGTPLINRLRRVVDMVMISLCDLQIVTGISILIAGFATFKNATYYHQSIVLQLWWLTLNSFWVARIEVERSHALQTNLPTSLYALTVHSPAWTMVRKLAIFCSVVLGLSYQGIMDVQQWWNWNSEVGGLCYISHDNTSNWIWTAGTSLYGLILLMTILPWTKPFIIRFFDLFEWTQENLVTFCKTCWRKS